MNQKILIVLISLINFTTQTCQTVSPIQLDGNGLEQYISKRWWITKQFETKYLKKENNYCVWAEYKKLQKKTFWGYDIQVHNHAQSKSGVQEDSGNMICGKISNPDNFAQLSVGVCYLPRFSFLNGPYWIIYYNEEQGMAIVSGGQPYIETSKGCKYNTNNINESGLWVLSRTQTLLQDQQDFATRKLQEFGFDIDELNNVDNTNC